MYHTKIPIGSKIKFKEEKQKYTVIASNIVFAICTKPMNAHKTVLYTIIDFFNKERWPENLIFWMWAESQKQCEEMLERLTSWETELSGRRSIKLNIEDIERSNLEKIKEEEKTEKLINDPISYENEILHEEINKIMGNFPNHVSFIFRKKETIWEIAEHLYMK